MKEASASPIKMALLNAALALKKMEVRAGAVRNDSLIDAIIFKKVRSSTEKFD